MRRHLLFIFLLALAGPVHCQLQQQEEKAWVDSVFNSLGREEKIAQLMIVRANEPGKPYFGYVDRYIEKYNIGGVCFFRGHPHEQVMATNRWQSLAKTPLLVSMDAEWGLGMRLDSTIAFPYQMTLGAITDDKMVYRMGTMVAEQCQRIGVHMNFAPVVDINSNPGNPVIGMRSFGQDRELVTRMGLAYMQGLQDGGIIATAKHFPGHGDTDTDSHKTLPVLKHSPERLDSLELFPFRQLIDKGLGGIMVAHLHIPAYEDEEGLASTLSGNIVHKLLREQMGFSGLVVTDALDMKGVTDYHRKGEIELMALLAGNDILLLPADVPAAIRRISRALDKGELKIETLDEHVRRVLKYKYRAGLSDLSPVSTDNLVRDLNAAPARALNSQLYESSATLVRNERGLLPLERPDTLQIAYVSCGGDDENDHFGETLGLYGRVRSYTLPGKSRKRDIERLMDDLQAYNLVIAGIRNTNIYAHTGFGISDDTWSFINELAAATSVVLDVFASPYALMSLDPDHLPEAVIVSYQDNPLSEETAAEIIFGGVPARGRLPAGAGKVFPSGSGMKTRATRLQFVEPYTLGISDSFMKLADSIALSGIAAGAYPGCQVMAAKDGKVFFHKAYGHQTYAGEQEVTTKTIYDLASLTKIAATTLAVMDLSEEGSIDIDRRLSYYLPYLRDTDKENVIIREMLAHQSRFRAWIPYFRYTVEGDNVNSDIYSRSASEDFPYRVAEGIYIHKDYHHMVIDSIRFSALNDDGKYLYSDLGFYLLKEAMENICNMPFETYVERKYYAPLGLPSMGYLPLHRFGRERIAPTENDRTFRMQLLRGDVHDQGAAMLGGVSGHAGLFSNAFDMAVIMQMFLDGGRYGGRQFVEDESIREYTKTQFPLNGNRRGIGFDKPMLVYDEDGPSCRSASGRSFGHSGFTGTYAWADPENGLVYVFLSNRVHPDAYNPKIMELDIRTNLHQVFYDAIDNSSP